jgi:hypothetical protein
LNYILFPVGTLENLFVMGAVIFRPNLRNARYKSVIIR